MFIVPQYRLCWLSYLSFPSVGFQLALTHVCLCLSCIHVFSHNKGSLLVCNSSSTSSLLSAPWSISLTPLGPPHAPWQSLCLEKLCIWKFWTELVTNSCTGRVQHPPKNESHLWSNADQALYVIVQGSDSQYCTTEQDMDTDMTMPSPSQQNTCRLGGQAPRHPWVSLNR